MRHECGMMRHSVICEHLILCGGAELKQTLIPRLNALNRLEIRIRRLKALTAADFHISSPLRQKLRRRRAHRAFST
jgi:hypothetical protein